MIHLFAVLATLQLFQLEPIALFDVCYLDVNAHPHEFRPDPKSRRVRIIPAQVIAFTDASRGRGGIDCVVLRSSSGRVFVVGTIQEVCRELGYPLDHRACQNAERKTP